MLAAWDKRSSCDVHAARQIETRLDVAEEQGLALLGTTDANPTLTWLSVSRRDQSVSVRTVELWWPYSHLVLLARNAAIMGWFGRLTASETI